MGTDGNNAAGCSKRLSSKVVASKEARRTLRHVEPLSDARTMLAAFFSILLNLRACLLVQPDFERITEHAFMVCLVPGNAGVIFQLQHLLNHAHRIRRTLSLMIFVPYSKTTLTLARHGVLEDMPITV